MLGAIIGDIVGSPYEFGSRKKMNFPLFSSVSTFTDDTVLTLAVAEAIMDGQGDRAKTEQCVIDSMRKYGNMYPDAGYGDKFEQWLQSDDPRPYHSCGNGSAMRVSSVAWAFDTLDEVESFAGITADVTHNHPEGIWGAQAAAAAVFLARTGRDKEGIRKYIEMNYGYDLQRTCDQIRPDYHFHDDCMQTVPEAIICFLDSTDYENCIRLAISLGGDGDTLAAIAGSIAEAFYGGVPDELKEKALSILPEPLRQVYDRWEAWLAARKSAT